MDKTVRFHYLVANYHKVNYTSNYVFGKTIDGIVYAAVWENVKVENLLFLAKLDRASKKNSANKEERDYSLRYEATSSRWTYISINANNVFPLCTEITLKEYMKKHKKNKGEAFEALVAKFLKGTQNEISNLRFDKGGDITVDGKSYLVKFNRASFATETAIESAKFEKGI